MTVTIEQTTDIAACHGVRRAVFIVEQGISEAEEMDTLDGSAIHLLARDGTRPIGTSRLLVSGNVGKIGRVCVLSSERGRGIGAQMIQAGIEMLRSMPGITIVRLGAQVPVLGFYEHLGFVAHGPVYDDAGIPHRTMDFTL